MLQCCIFQIRVSGNCPRMRQIANKSNFRFTSQSPWHLHEVRDSILGFTSRSPFKSLPMCLHNWTYIAESGHLRMIWPHFLPFFCGLFLGMVGREFSSVSGPWDFLPHQVAAWKTIIPDGIGYICTSRSPCLWSIPPLPGHEQAKRDNL
jgi:hypothetical protein